MALNALKTLKNYRTILKDLVEILDELIEICERETIEEKDLKRQEELMGKFLFKMMKLQNIK